MRENPILAPSLIFSVKLYIGIEAHIVAAKARFVSHTGIVGVAKGKIIESFFVASGNIDNCNFE